MIKKLGSWFINDDFKLVNININKNNINLETKIKEDIYKKFDKHICLNIKSNKNYKKNKYFFESNFPLTTKSKSKEFNKIYENLKISDFTYDKSKRNQYLNLNGLHTDNNNNNVDIKYLNDYNYYTEELKKNNKNWYGEVEKKIRDFHECIDRLNMDGQLTYKCIDFIETGYNYIDLFCTLKNLK